ncbi:hypothetical protein AB6D04_01005 [Vibrio splendidus]|uniref:hypothetical protein n=1 Tax=Vibrio splendidus TaxID=29497 RepID=UPI000C82936F|nr:hypothetical protein [Vibrio splendidus]PMN84568.1 hypothetical protein BCT24_01035 [Vibrio splendidus]
MTLSNNYSIATRHQRSTRIDSDLSKDFFPGLVYHGTAQTALETLLRQYAQTGQRSYTLTGPYGSGKSTIALLLTGLLHHEASLRNAALDVINSQSKKLLKDSIVYDKGWLQIRSVGGLSSPVKTFWNATLAALKEHHKTNTLYEKYCTLSIHTESELVNIWEALFEEAHELVDGVLLLADEMGKSLEYINKSRGELHLFQDIAEVLGRTKTPVIFMGLLHQSFSEYAKERGSKLQEEWNKIQGRYNDIIYNVSTDETVALIGQSIQNESGERCTDDHYVNAVLEAMNDKQERKKLLKERLDRCIPLHPTSALLLGPISKRRFSQNERSTFSFLNSHEQNSFQLFLKTAVEKSDRYNLVDLWDYLEVNLEHAIISSPDGHAWATATEAIRQARQKGLPDIATEILKTIALITLFGKPANLTATEELLLASTDVDTRESLTEYLNMLKDKSCIIYRKHLSSWMVFEGSDLDIPSLIEEKVEQIKDVQEAITHAKFQSQVIAKGHYHTTGTLRWAEQNLVTNLEELEKWPSSSSSEGAFISFYLVLDDSEQLKKASQKNDRIVLARANDAEEIIALAKECYALDLIKSDEKIGRILTHDKVAQKEYEGRLINAELALNNAILYSFESSTWCYRGEEYSHESLSHVTTLAADHIFDHSPEIKNELVNRNKLSGTAVSALKKLLEAMLKFEEKEDLGINGFPPEKSMYISCLKNTSIHDAKAKDKRYWHTENLDPKLSELFIKSLELLEDSSGKEVKLSEIAELWAAQPYGLTKGVIPIFLLAFLKSQGSNIAYYEKDMSGSFAFIAQPDLDYVHKLIKNQDELAVKYIVLEKSEREWLQHLAVFASNETNKQITTDILSVATPLVTTIHNLPQWVKNAHELVPEDATKNKIYLRIRDLFLQANDPHALLIKDLHSELNLDGVSTLTQQIDILSDCFSVLRQKHERMLGGIKDKVKVIFPEAGEELVDMCRFVEENAGDLRLKAFARELAKSNTGLLQWLESMIQIVVGRGKQNWNEGILRTADNKISDYAQDFLSVVKSQRLQNNENSEVTKTKLVSLVLEGEDGKLTSYKKEVRVAEVEKIQPVLNAIEAKLNDLNEFEKVHVLQKLLKKTLEAQV